MKVLGNKKKNIPSEKRAGPPPPMKLLRKFFGLKPAVGDTVGGGLDFGVSYSGVVIETRYNTKMRGAYVSGKITLSNMWKGEIVENHDRFFVPLSRLKIT